MSPLDYLQNFPSLLENGAFVLPCKGRVLSPTNSLSNVNMQNHAEVLDSDQPEKHLVLQNTLCHSKVRFETKSEIEMGNNLNQVWYPFQNKSFHQVWE